MAFETAWSQFHLKGEIMLNDAMSKNECLMKYREERQRCTCWTRVMGYIRSKDSFNLGKQSEAEERVYFTEQCACKQGK